MNAISLLKDDHRRIEQLFKQFEKSGERAQKTRQKLAAEIIREVVVHGEIEEMVFYPAVRERIGDTEEDVLESLEEHHVAKLLMAEIERTSPQSERFAPKVKVLIESVRHHKKEEEEQLFPRVRKALKPKELEELGQQLEQARAVAPTHPHPRAPDEPPAKFVAGTVAAVMDAGRDIASGVVRRARARRQKS